MTAKDGIVRRVRAGRRRVEHDRDVVESRHLHEAVDPAGGHRHAEPARTGETVRVGIDADERAHLELVRRAQDLDHQVRADVAAPDDGDFDAHRALPRSVIMSTLPMLYSPPP
jgi:hypothetical protein